MTLKDNETLRRITSWKYYLLVFTSLFMIVCTEVSMMQGTLCVLSRRNAMIEPNGRDTTDNVSVVVDQNVTSVTPSNNDENKARPFGTAPPNGHPWHTWAGPSINPKYVIEELSIIDSLNSVDNKGSSGTRVNTTFRLPHYETLMPFVVRNGVAFHPKSNKNKRYKRFVDMLAGALNLAKKLQHVPRIRAVTNGSFPFLLSLSDVEKCNDYSGKEIPVFSWYTVTGCEYSWPVPYPQFCSAAKDSVEEWTNQFAEWEETYPWNDKVKKAVWRGSMTGPNNPDWRELPRSKLAFKSLEDRNRTIDAAFVDHAWRKRTPKEEDARSANLEVPRMEFNDFMKSRAILDLDGNAWSGRFGTILCLNSVVIKVESPAGYKSYYELDEVRPWEHYIPVSSNMSDLDEAVSFAISDENQDKVQAIIKNAQSWCRSKLTKDQLADDLLWTLVSYVEMLNKNGSEWQDRWIENSRAYNLPALDMQAVAAAALR